MGKSSRREQIIREMQRKAEQQAKRREDMRREACEDFQAAWMDMNERMHECWLMARRLRDEYGFDTGQLVGQVGELTGGAPLSKRMTGLLSATSDPSARVDYLALAGRDMEDGEVGGDPSVDAVSDRDAMAGAMLV